MDSQQYRCGHPRTPENTCHRRRWRKKTGDYRTIDACRECHKRYARNAWDRTHERTRASKYLVLHKDLGTDEVDL